MKKMKNLITGMLLVLALGVFTACGENKDRNADETGTMKEDVEKRDDNKENTEDQNRDMTDKKDGSVEEDRAEDPAMEN